MKDKTETKSALDMSPLVITRSFHAPRKAVFEAMTTGDQIKQWWGPENFTCPFYETDRRVGGKYLGCMRTPDGQDMWSTGHFIEIKAPVSVKYSDSFSDKDGNIVSATSYGMSKEFPLECIVEMQFDEEDKGQGTKLSLKHFGIPQSDFDDCTQGWKQSLDKLASMLEGGNKVGSKVQAGAKASSTSARPNA